jgi:hypothetical protein
MPKGRKDQRVEFFRLLAKILKCEQNHPQLAKRIGKQISNVQAYNTGREIPGILVLRSAMRHAFEWEAEPILEVQPIGQRKHLTNEPEVYCLYDSSGSVIYVGQAKNLEQEVSQTLQRKMNFPVRTGPTLSKKSHPKYKSIATHVSAYNVASPRMRHNLEALLLRAFPNQSHNNKMGNFR